MSRIIAESTHELERERAEARAAPAPRFVRVYYAEQSSAYRRCVYALLDPREPGAVMYVGMTTGHPLVRLEGHLREAEPKRDRRAQPGCVPKRTIWIRALRNDGILPMLAVLEVVPEGECLEDCEQKWIRFYVLRGEAKMNGQMRGAAFFGMKR